MIIYVNQVDRAGLQDKEHPIASHTLYKSTHSTIIKSRHDPPVANSINHFMVGVDPPDFIEETDRGMI